MSFICGVCGKSAPVGTKCKTIPIERKEFQHPYRNSVHVIKHEDGKKEYNPDVGGKGVQTVREVKACIKCADSEALKFEKTTSP